MFIPWAVFEDLKAISIRTGMFTKIAAFDKGQMNKYDVNIIDNFVIHTHFSDAISQKMLDKMHFVIFDKESD